MLLAELIDTPPDSPRQQKQDSTLYVNNIDPKVEEHQLNGLFNRYAPVITLKLRNPPSTDRNKCKYALIQYANQEDARKTAEQTQYFNLEGREIIVIFASDRTRLKKEGKVFIKNIPSDFETAKLHNIFSVISLQLYAVIMKAKKGQPTTSGFVHFFEPAHAKQAIDSLQGWKVGNNSLLLEEYQEKNQEGDLEEKILLVQNLPKNEDKSLQNFFEQFGEIESFDSKWNDKYQASSATVKYTDKEDAEEFYEKFTKEPIKLGRNLDPIIVKWYKSKKAWNAEAQNEKNKLYLQSLKHHITKEELNRAFDQIRPVVSSSLIPRLKNKEIIEMAAVLAFRSEEDAEAVYAKAPKVESIQTLFTRSVEIYYYKPKKELDEKQNYKDKGYVTKKVSSNGKNVYITAKQIIVQSNDQPNFPKKNNKGNKNYSQQKNNGKKFEQHPPQNIPPQFRRCDFPQPGQAQNYNLAPNEMINRPFLQFPNVSVMGMSNPPLNFPPFPMNLLGPNNQPNHSQVRVEESKVSDFSNVEYSDSDDSYVKLNQSLNSQSLDNANEEEKKKVISEIFSKDRNANGNQGNGKKKNKWTKFNG